MRKKMIAALAAVAGLGFAGTALAHNGDFTTQQQNAVRFCVSNYSGCTYVTWNYVDPYGAHPYRRFYFWRRHSDGVHKCYIGVLMNHYNVYSGNTVYTCQ